MELSESNGDIPRPKRSLLPSRRRLQHSQVEASHLYQKDDQGNVQSRTLIPCPTHDPLDPLIWSSWRKHLVFASVNFYLFLSNYTISAVTPGFQGIIRDFGVTPTQCGYLVSYQLLLLGIGNLFWVPLSLKIGKRPVCVVSSALFFATSIWSAVAKSYGSLLASRIVGGFAASVVEVIGPAVVADIYFLHERGTMTGISIFMIGGGSALGGVFAGLVIHGTDNWRWIFWMCTILTGVCFLFLTLFYQETNFIRPAEAEGGDKAIVDQASFRSPYSLRQALTLFAWYDRSTSIWVYFFRPLPLLLYPAVLWATVCYGVVLGWVVFQISSNAVLFAEIYNFSPFGIGNLYIANVVGAFVGCLYSGPFNDWFCATITKRKTGMFQPEYRLYLMIPLFFLGPVGLLMWGVGLQNRVSWAVPAVGSGISYAVLCMNPNISLTYIIDGYRPVAGEAFTSLTAAKNAVAFGLSFAVFPWINRSGLAHVAGYQTLIEGVVFLTTIPLFIYGARLRRWCSQFDF